MLKPPTIAPPKTDVNDPRLGHWLSSKKEDPEVVLIGFPSDEGVKRNGGRAGAALAPEEIRKELYKMTPDAEETELPINLLEGATDIGNVDLSGEVAKDQDTLGNVVNTTSHIEELTKFFLWIFCYPSRAIIKCVKNLCFKGCQPKKLRDKEKETVSYLLLHEF